MGAIVAFLFNHKSLVIIALLALALTGTGIQIKFLKNQKAELVSEKERLQTLLDVSQANVKQLQGDIQAQNEQVEKFKKDADERQAANQVIVKKATEQAAIYKKKSDDLLKRQPPSNMSSCEAADALINEEIQNANK